MGILAAASAAVSRSFTNIALKPTSSITVPGHTINRFGEEVEMIIQRAVTIRASAFAVPIAEAMLAIVLMDHFCVGARRMAT